MITFRTPNGSTQVRVYCHVYCDLAQPVGGKCENKGPACIAYIRYAPHARMLYCYMLYCIDSKIRYWLTSLKRGVLLCLSASPTRSHVILLADCKVSSNDTVHRQPAYARTRTRTRTRACAHARARAHTHTHTWRAVHRELVSSIRWANSSSKATIFSFSTMPLEFSTSICALASWSCRTGNSVQVISSSLCPALEVCDN